MGIKTRRQTKNKIQIMSEFSKMTWTVERKTMKSVRGKNLMMLEENRSVDLLENYMS